MLSAKLSDTSQTVCHLTSLGLPCPHIANSLSEELEWPFRFQDLTQSSDNTEVSKH